MIRVSVITLLFIPILAGCSNAESEVEISGLHTQNLFSEITYQTAMSDTSTATK